MTLPDASSSLVPAGALRAEQTGMMTLDTSGNARVRVLMELVGALSRAGDPQDVLRSYASGMRRLRGPFAYLSLSTRGLGRGQFRITRFIPGDSPLEIVRQDPWSLGDQLPVHEGGFFGRLVQQAFPEIIHHFHLRGDPVLGDRLAQYGSLMAIPLFDEGEPLNWAVMLHDDEEAWSVAELEENILRANLVGTAVRYVRNAQLLRAANDRIGQEMELIAEIQRSLLPDGTIEVPGYALATSYAVHDTAGGDYYDVVPLEDGRWLVVVADAAGHGPAAAVMMAIVQTLLHALPAGTHCPAEICAHLNRHLCAKRISGSFVTALVGLLDPVEHAFTWSRAGHPPALLKNPGAEAPVRRLDQVGELPLGVLTDVRFESARITIEPGQTIVLFTDGIMDARSPEGEIVGVEGLERALHRCTGEPECVVQSLETALREHERGRRPVDDRTILAIKRRA